MTTEPSAGPRQEEQLPLPPAALLALGEVARRLVRGREADRLFALSIVEGMLSKPLSPEQRYALAHLPPAAVAVALGALAAERLRGGR